MLGFEASFRPGELISLYRPGLTLPSDLMEEEAPFEAYVPLIPKDRGRRATRRAYRFADNQFM